MAAVALMLFVILPRMADTLAMLMPIEREVAFGKAVVTPDRTRAGRGETGRARSAKAPKGALRWMR